VCSTVSALLLAVAGFVLAFYGVAARRILSAAALATTTYSVAARLLGLVQLQGSVPPEILAAALSVVGFFVGLLSYRLAVSVSAGYAAFVLAERVSLVSLPLDIVYTLAVGLALATYVASLKRVYLPYVVLGATTLAIALSTLTHGTLAIALATLVGIAGYLVQDSTWRARVRLVKRRVKQVVAKHRGVRMGRGSTIPRGSTTRDRASP